MINSILIEGRVVKQPEIKTLDNEKQTKIAVFSIAHHNIKNECIFLSVTGYNSLCSAAEKLQKGDRITIQGRLNVSVWEKEGEKHQRPEIIADLIHFTGMKKNDPETNSDETDETDETPF